MKEAQEVTASLSYILFKKTSKLKLLSTVMSSINVFKKQANYILLISQAPKKLLKPTSVVNN